MAQKERQDIIKRLEGLRSSRVITLITGDRAVAPTVIADDCLSHSDVAHERTGAH